MFVLFDDEEEAEKDVHELKYAWPFGLMGGQPSQTDVQTKPFWW